MTSGPRFRFAPSPTGSFHVGGARTALQNWALARRLGGTFVLRIEDTDEARNRPEWTQGIIDALAWIGISSDDPHFEGPHFQSEYADAHLAAAQRLFEDGHAYYCDLTGEQVQSAPRNSVSPATTGTRVTVGSDRVLATSCDSVCPTAPPWSTTSCAARSRSTTARSRTSCWCAATARRCSCWPTSSTTSRWRSPTSCAPRSICPTPPSSRCCGRRSAMTAAVGARAGAGQRAAQEAVEAS